MTPAAALLPGLGAAVAVPVVDGPADVLAPATDAVIPGLAGAGAVAVGAVPAVLGVGSTEQLAWWVLLGSLVVLGAVLGVRVAGRVGVPGLLLYLGIGLLLGEDVLGIDFDDAALATVLGYAALALILAEGGLTTSTRALRPVFWPALSLASVGVAVSIVVVAVPLVVVAGLDTRTALLLSTVLAATDAAAVFTVLRRLPVPGRLRSLLEAESGFNDAPVVVIVATLASASWTDTSAWVLPIVVVAELVGGALVGLGVGYAGRWVLPRLALPAAGLYPLATIALLLVAYGSASVLRASGFLAVYLAGVVVGSGDLPHRRTVLGFADGLAWVAQIGLFVMLGLLADPSRLVDAALPAAVAGIALLLLGRPVSVPVAALPFRLPWRDRGFLSWAGLRGAVPIVFAAIPLGAGTPDAVLLFDATFLLVIVLTLVQTPTLPWVAGRLGVVEAAAADELDVESAPLDDVRATLLSIAVPRGSELVGTYVRELGLPEGAVVSLVVRGGLSQVPDVETRLRAHDRLLVVTPTRHRAETVARLRAVHRRGRLARWLGDTGSED